MILYATGAYGRKASLADWKSGKDFRVRLTAGSLWVGGPYFSSRDVPALRKLGYESIRFFDDNNASLIGFRVDLDEAEEKRA